uniref:Uncharacterized protein n=1 Tax=Otus sunia TaxID=257818 RepID=A0A8C8AE50_9STRI
MEGGSEQLLGLGAAVGMELKVWVDGIQRVVCGVSEQTTCQEVVIALARAIDGPLRAGAEAAGEGAAAAAAGVSLGVAGQVRAVRQRCAVRPAAHGPQRGRATLLGGHSPSPREDVHPGQLAHQTQARRHGCTPLPGAKKIHDLQLGSYRLRRPVCREPLEAPSAGRDGLGGWWGCPALQGGAV